MVHCAMSTCFKRAGFVWRVRYVFHVELLLEKRSDLDTHLN